MTQPPRRDIDTKDETDRILLRQISEDRSTVAMQSLYESYRSRLVPFLKRMTSDHSVIEETYNDVMLTLWNKSDQFKGESKVSSWIFRIAYRDCLKLIRKQKFRQQVLDKLLFQTQEDEQEQEHESDDGIQSEALNLAIQSLPSKQRMVIELSYFEGYSVQEISEIASCPSNTVKTRLHHARQKIRVFMDAAKLNENSDNAEH